MIRKRDLVLFLASFGFLLVAITVTGLWQQGSRLPVAASLVDFATDTATYTAAVITIPDSKNDRLAALRQKLAEGSSYNAVSEPETPPEPEVVAEQPASTTTDGEVVDTPQNPVVMCGDTYAVKTIPRLTGMQYYREGEGQRVFFNQVLLADSSSTTAVVPTEEVVFTLPLRTTPLAFTSCISDDVVAISPTGVRIKNTDYAKYQGSGEAALLGYTLDGFPLYGRTNSITTDECGGAMIDGSYRYYLSAERDGVIGCFAGIPVTL